MTFEQYQRAVGRRIRTARWLLGWTQEDASAKAKLTYRYYTELERGRANPTMATVTPDLKGAKPITVALSKDKPTWAITITADPRGKRIIRAPKIVFDAVAAANLRATQAKAEADTAKAQAAKEKADAQQARDQARADAEAAQRARDQAQADDEAAQRARDQADADAERAKKRAEAERLKRIREEARSKVSLSVGGCSCGPGHTMQATCRITNGAEIGVYAKLYVGAETGTFGVSGAAVMVRPSFVGVGQSQDLNLVVPFQALAGCNSCRTTQCTLSWFATQ